MDLCNATQLNNRVLWYDGASSYHPSALLKALNLSDIHYVTEITPDIATFNQYVTQDKELRVKTECEEITNSWTIPAPYSTLNIEQYLVNAHEILFRGVVTDDEFDAREYRLCQEIIMYRNRGLDDVIRAVIWIINTLTANDIVWGVGRGSSVSSYALYVIGVHDVDSYTYALDVEDFLHD